MTEHRKYMLIYGDLERQILSGRYKPSERLPTVDELCREYGASRQTIGRAYRKLHDDDLIERTAGLGWFVVANLPRRVHMVS
jgi:GntR family transcriptional regulator